MHSKVLPINQFSTIGILHSLKHKVIKKVKRCTIKLKNAYKSISIPSVVNILQKVSNIVKLDGFCLKKQQ